MKKLLMIILSVSLFSAVTAQRHGVVVVRSYAPVYSSFNVGLGYGYSPFYNPYYSPYGYNNNYRPSKLDNQIADITHDYADKIESVRLDKTLSGSQRREEIRNLKKERDNEINEVKINYHKQKS